MLATAPGVANRFTISFAPSIQSHPYDPFEKIANIQKMIQLSIIEDITSWMLNLVFSCPITQAIDIPTRIGMIIVKITPPDPILA